MDSVTKDFETLKISALNKVKLINNECNNVTIGPNCEVFDKKINPEKKSPVKDGLGKIKNKSEENNKNHANIPQEKVAFCKLLAEAEKQRRDEVETNIRSRLANMNAASQKFDANSKVQWLRTQKRLIEQNREQENRMIQILDEHDRRASDFSKKIQLEYQKQENERHKRNLELQKQEEEKQELRGLIEDIIIQHKAFKAIYQDIVGIIKASNNPKAINKIITENAEIKTLPDAMDKIKERCKDFMNVKITGADLHLAMTLVEDVAKLKDSITAQVAQMKLEEIEKAEQDKQKEEQEKQKNEQERIRLQQEQQQKELIEKQKIQAESQISQQTISNPTRLVTNDLKFVSKENLRMYAELQQFLDTYENSFQMILTDPKLKQFKFACQKAVNIPLNAISSLSSQHLQDKYQRLSNLLSGKSVEAGGTVVCASKHPQGIAYCTNLLAKKFVQQGDLIVSSNPESAHYFAAVLISIWVDFPDFGKLILAHFYKEVPYLVPMYPLMLQGQTDQDYYKSLGYHYIDGVVEKQDKFLKRMTGTMRLYSAILICRLKRNQHDRGHPHGLMHGWRWFASILNLDPSIDITATMIFEFLEVAGSSMQQAYGKQFDKLLTYLINIYLPKIQQIDSGGPMTRLEVLLQKIQKTRQINPSKGRLTEGFW